MTFSSLALVLLLAPALAPALRLVPSALALPLQSAGSGEGLRVTALPPRAGDGVRVTSKVTNRIAVKFTVDGALLRDFEQELVDDSSFEATLLAAPPPTTPAPATDAAAVLPVAQVKYGKCESHLRRPEGDKSTASDVNEQEYQVVRERELLATKTLKDGESVAYDVDRRVLWDLDELLHGGRLARLLDAGPLTLERPLEVPAEVAQAFFQSALEAADVKSFVLTPTGARKVGDVEGVVLAAAATLTMTEPQDPAELQITTRIELTGELVVGTAGGRLLALDLTGPIRFSGGSERNEAKIEVTGTGTLTWTYRAR